jgi:predicted PurR-regulated permease PerM
MDAQDRNSQDITRTTLSILFIGVLLATSVWILRPFLTSIVWAVIIVVATWPLLLWIQKGFWGKRGLAVAAMTAILLLVVMAPLVATVSTIVSKSDDITTGIKSLGKMSVPPPPGWVGTIPFAGRWLAEQWQHYASLAPEELAALVVPYAYTVLNWFIAQAGSLAAVMLQFLLTVILAAVMYAGGEKAAAWVTGFARRLGGQNGEEVVVLAAKAVRSVALGVVATALVQTAIGGAGLFICGAPLAPLLTAVTLICCLAQLGATLPLVTAVIYFYWRGEPFWGTVMLIFLIVTTTVDNFLRPILIRKGVDLPLMLVFAGVIGGLIAFGAIGLFIGPVVLAIAFTLTKAWIAGDAGQMLSGTKTG